MKFSRIIPALLAVASLAAFTACSESEEEKKLTEDNKVLSPTDSKGKLETIAQEAMSLLKTEDQQPLVELAEYIARNYEGIEMPKEWKEVFGETDYDEYNPAYVIKKAGECARNRSYDATHTYTETYAINYNELKGEYYAKEGDECWTKVGNSDNIVFHCLNEQGNDVYLTIEASGEYPYNDTITEEEYSNKYITEISVVAPTSIKATLTDNGVTLLSTETSYSLDLDAHKVSGTTNTSLCNVNVQSTFNATDAKLSETSTISVGGQMLATSTATINGENLCNPNNWKYLGELDEDELMDEIKLLLSSAQATVNVMDNLTVKANVPDVAKLITAINAYDLKSYDHHDFDRVDIAEQTCKAALRAIEETYDAAFYYGKSENKQGTLSLSTKTYLDREYSEYFWVEPVAVLKFDEDGSVYEFEEYFGGTDFMETRDKFNSLVRRYRTLLRNLL